MLKEKPRVFKAENGKWIARWLENVEYHNDRPHVAHYDMQEYYTWQAALYAANIRSPWNESW